MRQQSKELLSISEKTGDLYVLVPGDVSGYYEQIQGAMAIVGVTVCDFVAWTPNGTLVVSVDFDQEFWVENLKSKLVSFFSTFVVPEILTERI